MRRMRAIAAGAACLVALSLPAFGHERCGCGGGEVLNGRLNTADFDGGVGDRYGDGGVAYGGGYAITYGGAPSGAFAGASASASARASAYARASVTTHFVSFHGGGHGGGMHGGGMHGGYGGGHH